MNFMQATPRARHDNNRFIWRAGLAVGTAVMLTACGGGGDGGSGGTPTSGQPITRTEAVVGDYFVYAMTSIPIVPAGGATTSYNSTVTYRSIATDGTNQRVTSRSDISGLQQATYNTDVALVSNENFLGGAAICTYSPPAPAAPPYPRAVGQSWSGTSVQGCIASTATLVLSGQIVAREDVVLPAGTFDAYRASRTNVTTSTTSVITQSLTCWYSVDRGVLLRCDITNTTTPAGSSTPSSVASVSQVLTAMGGPARPRQGAVLLRFQGFWRVQYSGGASGSCAQLYINATGVISGNCSTTGGSTFAVTGTVDANGEVSISLPTGGALTGTLSNPYTGTGAWIDSGLSGAWSALRT